MATRIIQIIDDDLGDGEATGKIKFGLESVWYEIDLNDKNQEAFHKAIEKFLKAARRVGGKQAPRTGAAPAKKAASSGKAVTNATAGNTTPYANKDIREWARETGIDVPERGRIPQEVIDQYVAAQEAA